MNDLGNQESRSGRSLDVVSMFMRQTSILTKNDRDL